MSPPRHSCVFPGCHSVQGDGSVSLFQFPSDDNVRKRWIDFVERSYCGELKITTNTRLCGVHFTPDSYSHYHQVKSGYLKSLLTLVSVTEPTLSNPGLRPTVPPTAGVAITDTGVTFPPESTKQCPPNTREAACQCGHVKKDSREMGCQTDRYVGKRTVATQMSKITLAKRNSTGFPADVPDGVSWKRGLKLQDHLHIKKEEEELWESVEEKQEIIVISKNKDGEEEAQCSLLRWRRSVENIKGEPATCSSAFILRRQQDTDGEETDCSDTEDSEDWREPLSQSEAQSEHMDMSWDSTHTSDHHATGTTHNRKKRFGCNKCGKQFSCKSNLKIHTRTHTGEKPVGCDVHSETSQPKTSLAGNMTVYTQEKPHDSDVCSRKFNHESNISKHVRIHTVEKPSGCDEELQGKQETDITAVTVKSEDEEEEAQCSLLHWRQSEENIKGEPATCSSAKLLKVEPNGDISEGPEAANTWTQQDTDGEETDCSDTEDSEDWREPLSQSEAQSEHMDMSWDSTHTSDHHATATTHKREKRFGRDVCGKRFSDTSHLKSHTRTHTGEKPFSCDVCGEQFSDREHLKSHTGIHTGEKHFGCDVCGKHFGHRGNLKAHMKIHTGEKPYACNICQKRFIKNSDLNRHAKVHAKEKLLSCDVCGKQIRYKTDLKRHMETHTREKPYGCDVCQERFILQSDLDQHVIIHTGAGSPNGVPRAV